MLQGILLKVSPGQHQFPRSPAIKNDLEVARLNSIIFLIKIGGQNFKTILHHSA